MRPIVTRLEVRYGDLDPYGHVNNAVYLEFFEAVRIAYWRALARSIGVDELEAGEVPGARFVIAETTIRFRSILFLDDPLLGAATVTTVGDRSYAMDFELRKAADAAFFEDAPIVAESTAAHVFFDPDQNTVMSRPDWFLPAVAALEGRPEASFGREL